MTRTLVPILLYHSINPHPSSWIAEFTVSPPRFRRHLEVIRGSNRTPLTVDQLTRCLAGRAPMPTRPVVITFDDGYLDNLQSAAPLLAAEAIVATFYITTGFVGDKSPGGDPMLSWAGIRELHSAGHQIGAHSVRHPQLDTLSATEASDEVRFSRADLQDRLDLPIHSFAYPHGYASSNVRRLVRRAGFASACGVRNALSHDADWPYQLARLSVTRHTTTAQISLWLEGSGAPVATRREQLKTKIWRTYRRSRSRELRTGRGIR